MSANPTTRRILEQDQAQASEAQNVLNQQNYDREVAQYEKEQAAYEKEQAEIKAKGKEKQTSDFIGNTRTDHIVGVFNRRTVIHGDKRTEKQVIFDKKSSPNRKKKNPFTFSSKKKLRI